MDEERLRRNLVEVQGRIARAAEAAGRPPNEVRLVAVTKRNSPEAVRALVGLGVLDLGENYPQDLWRKAEALAGLPLRWHMIGHLQSNKARRTFPLVRMIHSVDSLALLERLDALAIEAPEPPRACLQVNASAEAAKHGWTSEGLLAEAERIAACKHLPIVGLMTMAAIGPDAAVARPAFARLRALRDELRGRTGLPLEELSMGMTGDFEGAIAEGATLVRIGSALFEGVEP